MTSRVEEDFAASVTDYNRRLSRKNPGELT
jgi:hypothetical protein